MQHNSEIFKLKIGNEKEPSCEEENAEESRTNGNVIPVLEGNFRGGVTHILCEI